MHDIVKHAKGNIKDVNRISSISRKFVNHDIRDGWSSCLVDRSHKACSNSLAGIRDAIRNSMRRESFTESSNRWDSTMTLQT